MYSINSNLKTIFEIYDDELKKFPIKMTGNLILNKYTIKLTENLGADENKKIESSGEESNDETEGSNSKKDTENECDIIIRLI